MQFLVVSNLSPEIAQRGLPDNFQELIAIEAAHAKEGYLDGSLRQLWLQQPGPGAVAIVEAGSMAEAEQIVKDFPMAKAGLLEAKVIGLKPFAGFWPG